MNKLKVLRTKKGVSQSEVAKVLGVTSQSYGHYEGGRRQPDNEMLQKLADYFNVSIDYLLDRPELPSNAEPLGAVTLFPVIGVISAGYDGEAVEEDTGEVAEVVISSMRGYDKSELFVLRIKGNSMYPDFIPNDLVLVHRQTSVDSGSVAVVMYNGYEATVKKVIYEKGANWLKLVPRNPEYETKLIKGVDLEDCRVLGKVISLIRRDFV